MIYKAQGNGIYLSKEEYTKLMAKISERQTVHKWLNNLEIPKEENGKKLCLLRRIRIALDQLYELKNPAKVDDLMGKLKECIEFYEQPKNSEFL